MLELLLGWVTGKAAGLVFKTIFSEDFVKDLIKDYGKDFCKYLPGKLGNLAMKPFQQEPVQKAVAMALIEFLKLVQQQLKIRCKLNDGEIKA
ncbi:MAG: NTPase, partial [Cyanobacteria bacterium J06636_27]